MRTAVVLLAAGAMTGTAPASAPAPAAAAAGQHRPVVFVHGYGADPGVWSGMRQKFKEAGYRDSEMHSYDYSGDDKRRTIPQLGKTFANWAQQNLGTQRFDVVAHSMGSLVTRHAIKQNLNGIGSQVIHWVSLAGPNKGAKNANLCAGVAPPLCTKAVVDMKYNSPFLRELNKAPQTPPPTRYMTYRTPCDEDVEEDRVMLDGADNRRIDLCRLKGTYGGSRPVHNGIIRDATVTRDVLTFLTTSLDPHHRKLRSTITGTCLGTTGSLAQGRMVDCFNAPDWTTEKHGTWSWLRTPGGLCLTEVNRRVYANRACGDSRDADFQKWDFISGGDLLNRRQTRNAYLWATSGVPVPETVDQPSTHTKWQWSGREATTRHP
ncbi:alpha/beta fold hydrolase [Streptomyces olivoreticuli]